jgi:hypothetical protein
MLWYDLILRLNGIFGGVRSPQTVSEINRFSSTSYIVDSQALPPRDQHPALGPGRRAELAR